MTVGEHLDHLTQELLERGFGEALVAVGVARESLDAEREITKAQIRYIADNIERVCAGPGNIVEMGIKLANLIEHATLRHHRASSEHNCARP